MKITLGEKLRNIRLTSNISKSDLAVQMDVGIGDVSCLEKVDTALIENYINAAQAILRNRSYETQLAVQMLQSESEEAMLLDVADEAFEFDE